MHWLPGQGTLSLHTWVSIPSPAHFFPPYLGAGELHSRDLDCFPCLQVLVQVLHSPHSPQFPSTEIVKHAETINDVYISIFQASDDVYTFRFSQYKMKNMLLIKLLSNYEQARLCRAVNNVCFSTKVAL